MSAKNGSFRPTVISVALLAAFGSASAQDADIETLIRPDSQVSAGIGVWTNDRPRQGMYDAMREEGAYGLIDADIVKRDEATGTWLKLRASNLGLDNREVRGEYNRQGNFGGVVEYGRTTYDNPYTFTTGLQGIGTTNLTVGTNLGTFARREVELGTTRELVRLGGSKMIFPGLEFKLDFRNETKTGRRQTGWGSAALFSVEPIDSTIRQLEGILQYSGERLQLSGGYYGSWYDNDNPLILQRLNRAGAGNTQSPGLTPLSQPLSNEAHQLFLDGGYNFTKTTRGTFKVAFTRATQDEHLPTYGLTGVNAPFVGAPSSLDGQVNTTLVQLGLSSRPMQKLSITGSLRYYDVNDKTPLRPFVGTGVVPTVWNTPQSFTTTSGKLEATYRLPANFAVTGGIDYASHDRSYPTVGTVYVPFRADVRELTERVQLKRSLSDTLNGSVAYLHSKRDGSDYEAANGSAPFSNQINPLHIADRDRDKIRLTLDWDPAERLSLQFRADYAQDDYPSNGRPYGPRDGSSALYSLDASYLISENWKLAAWYSYDLTKARVVNPRAPNGSAVFDAIKDTHIRDVGDAFGVSLRGVLSPRIDGGIGLDWFRSTSDYAQALSGPNPTLPAGMSPVPEIKNSLLRLRLDGKYAIDKASDLRFDLIYERWRTDDKTWSFANGEPFRFTTSNFTTGGATAIDGTTVSTDHRQSATFVGVRYIYKFQ